jgi:hypothetical protein
MPPGKGSSYGYHGVPAIQAAFLFQGTHDAEGDA